MDELALDIFRTDDFRATTMTELVGDIDYVPYELEAMQIFEPVYLRTTTVTLYEEDGQLHRIPTSERGSPEPLATRRGRTIRQIEGIRIAKRDRVMSHEIQDLVNPRLPTATRLMNANDLVQERQTELLDDLKYTEEFHRLGALQGVVMDADGTTELNDWFDEFGIAPPVDVTFDMDNMDEGELRQFIDENINTPILRALRRRRRPGTTIHALAGDEFWQKLISHPGYERLFLVDSLQARREAFGESMLWQSKEFAGVTWHHYYGDDDQELEIPADEAIFFPMGAKGVFKVYYMPGEQIGEANERAKEYYSIVSPDHRINMNEWVDIRVRAYPLFTCLCPQALLRGVLA